jgi:hypothetical protein
MAQTEADRVLLAQISGAARHLAWSGLDTREQWNAAVCELRQVANGRVDLLGELAGVSLGVGESQLDGDVYERIAELCLEAGADREKLDHWIEVGRSRAAHARIAPTPGALRRW